MYRETEARAERLGLFEVVCRGFETVSFSPFLFVEECVLQNASRFPRSTKVYYNLEPILPSVPPHTRACKQHLQNSINDSASLARRTIKTNLKGGLA